MHKAPRSLYRAGAEAACSRKKIWTTCFGCCPMLHQKGCRSLWDFWNLDGRLSWGGVQGAKRKCGDSIWNSHHQGGTVCVASSNKQSLLEPVGRLRLIGSQAKIFCTYPVFVQHRSTKGVLLQESMMRTSSLVLSEECLWYVMICSRLLLRNRSLITRRETSALS